VLSTGAFALVHLPPVIEFHLSLLDIPTAILPRRSLSPSHESWQN
jgi:hypothetical protein